MKLDQDHHHLNHHQGVVIHEMLHNLGVGHEQNRPDRNSLMSIDWTNIPIDKVISFSLESVDDEQVSQEKKKVVLKTFHFFEIMKGMYV